MFKIAAIVGLSSTLWAQPLSGDSLLIRGDFQQASQVFLSDTSQLENIIKGTRAALATQDLQEIQKADQSLGKLLAELSTDSPLFYEALILRSIISFKFGDSSKALLQFEASLRHSSHKQGPQELALCLFLNQEVSNLVASQKCADELKDRFALSYFQVKGIKIKVPKKVATSEDEVKKPIPSTQVIQPQEVDSSASSPYCVQVGAFGNKENAEFLKENLSFLNKGITITERAQNKGTLYLVRIQGFQSKAEAETYAQNQIAPQGLQYKVYSNN